MLPGLFIGADTGPVLGVESKAITAAGWAVTPRPQVVPSIVDLVTVVGCRNSAVFGGTVPTLVTSTLSTPGGDPVV